MLIAEIINELELLAPPILQESYDNTGLLTGQSKWECKGAIICLDSTEEVIEEAIQKGCNLVIAHHPIVFSGLKKITGKNYVERTIIKAIKNDIAIYAIHTNLDHAMEGVNKKMAEKLDLKNIKVLAPKSGLLMKLCTFAPEAHAENVRHALFSAGAGHIGNYDACSFNVSGIGTFRGNESSNPFIGKKGEIHREAEQKIEVIYPKWKEQQVLRALFNAHPYEEVAYDLHSLNNIHQFVGAGMIGELEAEMSWTNFFNLLKKQFNLNIIRHTKPIKEAIKTVALCGGSGSFLLHDAIKQQADVFITADYKYHQFFDADAKIMIADIGHFESEQFTSELLFDYLQQKFPTFALVLSETNTNPVKYF
ncbi:MAG: Nif3-like dinuclear metal center hexameric protein [Flavobacteriales bacterium]